VLAAYSLRIRTSTGRELEGVGSKRDRGRIVSRISALANDPRPQGCEKLAGAVNAWRVRQGDYRILFTVDDEARVVDVFKIGHRREVYMRQELALGKRPLKAIVNEALKRGLGLEAPALQEPYRIRPHSSRFLPGVDAGKLNQLADELEAGEFHVRHPARR